MVAPKSRVPVNHRGWNRSSPGGGDRGSRDSMKQNRDLVIAGLGREEGPQGPRTTGSRARDKRRAEQLARDSDLRLTPPTDNGTPRTRTAPLPSTACDDRLPEPGTVITREYKGRMLEVTVLETGFEHEGETYRTLSAVAKAITGSHCNGYLWFRLGKYAR